MPRGVNTQDEGRIQGRNVANANSSNIVAPGIVTDGLVLHLDAGNYNSYPASGTTWYDLSGRRNNGTLVNGSVYSRDGGGAIDFDGTNQYLTVPSSNLPSGTESFTYSFWVYFDSISGDFGGSGKAADLITGDAFNTVSFAVISSSFSSTTPNTISLGPWGVAPTGSCSASVAGIINNGNWYNIVLVRDGTASNKIYSNNTLLVSGNVSNSFTKPASNYTIFGTPTADLTYDAYFNGRSSQVLIYNRALTPTEVAQNFNATRARFNI